jgi:transcriptional regulator of met regulon
VRKKKCCVWGEARMRQTKLNSKLSKTDKEAFRKVTVTLPQDVYKRLIQESARRKIAGAPNRMLSALLREALTQYLDRLN